MLRIEGLSLTRGGGDHAFTVQLPQLYLHAGEIGALTGMSGCGKSTLLEVIGLILHPDQLTTYQLDGHSLTEMILTDAATDLTQRRSSDLGFMLQHGGLFPFLTVQQNIQLPRTMNGLPVQADWLDGAIDRLALRSKLQSLPKQLSMGERQRVAFLRAIAHQPKLLLADEPTAALDPYNAEVLYALITERVSALNIAALIVSHDLSLVEHFHLTHYQATLEDKGSVFYKK